MTRRSPLTRRIMIRLSPDEVAAVLAGTADNADAERLAELVEALDEWLYRGWFLPARWCCATYAPPGEGA